MEHVRDEPLTPGGCSGKLRRCGCCTVTLLLHTDLAGCPTTQVHGVDSSKTRYPPHTLVQGELCGYALGWFHAQNMMWLQHTPTPTRRQLLLHHLNH
jgi:hypothetical protein